VGQHRFITETKENLTTQDIKRKLFLATNHRRMTTWHMAEKKGKLEILQKI
jgi:hypothetical protein